MRESRSVRDHARVLAAALALLFAVALRPDPSRADFYEPRNGCRQPQVKREPIPLEDKVFYQSEVEEYRKCLEEFIDENRAAAARHENAAAAAEREWDGFQKEIY